MAAPRTLLANSLVIAIFVICYAAYFISSTTNQYWTSLAIVFDLLITAPVVYYFMIRKTAVSRTSVLRVFVLGLTVGGLLLTGSKIPALSFVKTWVAPVAELTLIIFIALRFQRAVKTIKEKGDLPNDFIFYCRNILFEISGNRKFSNIITSEIAVFYYLFKGKNRKVDLNAFTCYKENGMIMVYGSILGLLLIETGGMHFLFMLWNKKAAWILTGLSIYTCLQLFSHIRAMTLRTHVITSTGLYLRNGILGGDVKIMLENISEIRNSEKATPADAVNLSLLKGIEKHNVIISLHEPVTVLKGFGIEKKTSAILINVDKRDLFIREIEKIING